jgi:hypothetical protein
MASTVESGAWIPWPLLLTEGGLETWLVYHEGVDLPHFAAFDLIRRPGGGRSWSATTARSPSSGRGRAWG